ncbi:31164_t:CDS:2, partial [Gigaspora margarita]
MNDQVEGQSYQLKKNESQSKNKCIPDSTKIFQQDFDLHDGFDEADHNDADIKNKDKCNAVTKIEVDKKEKKSVIKNFNDEESNNVKIESNMKINLMKRNKVLLANVKEDENSSELDEMATLRSILINVNQDCGTNNSKYYCKNAKLICTRNSDKIVVKTELIVKLEGGKLLLEYKYDDGNRLVYDRGKLVALYNKNIVGKHGELRKYVPLMNKHQDLVMKFVKLKNNESIIKGENRVMNISIISQSSMIVKDKTNWRNITRGSHETKLFEDHQKFDCADRANNPGTDTLLDVNIKQSKNELDEKCKKWLEKVRKFSYEVGDIEIKGQALRSTYYDGSSILKRVLVEKQKLRNTIVKAKNDNNGNKAPDGLRDKEIIYKYYHKDKFCDEKSCHDKCPASDYGLVKKIERAKRGIMDVRIKMDKLEYDKKRV